MKRGKLNKVFISEGEAGTFFYSLFYIFRITNVMGTVFQYKNIDVVHENIMLYYAKAS